MAGAAVIWKERLTSFSRKVTKSVPDEALKCCLHLLSFYSKQESRKRGKSQMEKSDGAVEGLFSDSWCEDGVVGGPGLKKMAAVFEN